MQLITALGVLLVSMAAMSPAAEAAQPDRRAEDLVTLELANDVDGGCGREKLDFFRTFPDGTSGSAPFRIPRGKALVVTDFDWYYSSGTPGQVVILSLLMENLADGVKRRRTAESIVRLGPDGVGGASERMTTGFVVSSSARLCIAVANGPIGSPMRLSKVLVRGYLVDQSVER